MIVVQIAGHLGQDPETRFTPTNKKVTNFRVATNMKRGKKEKTIWWKVTIWGDRFDQKLQYLKKGSGVIISGEMGIPEIYTDKDGNPQTSFEIVADSIIFNPFGGKANEGTRTGTSGSSEEEGQDEFVEEYAVRAPSYKPANQDARKPSILHGSQQANNDFEDDIPF